jgi:serine protease inhibitor
MTLNPAAFAGDGDRLGYCQPMQESSVPAAVLGMLIAVGLSGTACQKAHVAGGSAAGASSTSEGPAKATMGGAGGEQAVTNASAGGATAAAPLATAALPEGVTRRSEESVEANALSGAVKANNQFATELFSALRSEVATKNFLTSPISASLALGMTYAGARGQTQAEMARALRFGALSEAAVLSGQNALSQQLTKRGASAFEQERAQSRGYQSPPQASDYALEIVNSLWGQTGYPWERPFLQALAENYGAGLFNRDFRREPKATRLEINGWVSSQTGGKIQDLLGDSTVTTDTRLVLVNALHLKLPWAQEFLESETRPEPFTPSKQKPVKVPFMHRQDELPYRDDGAAQIVALPLSGRQLWVIIALPHVGLSLASYEHTLRGSSAALAVPTASALVALSLPKVTFTSESFSLVSALKRLGMVQAFDSDQAHFEGMCSKLPPGDQRLVISDVLQKTMISLQERGVEAAAATAVIVARVASMRVPPKPLVPIPMKVNRPYLLAVVDEPTGAVLMLGHIEEPHE